MKKFFIFAAVACVTLASCVKNEGPVATVDQPLEITIAAPVLSPNVKSANEFCNDFPTDVEIGLWAYYYVNSTNSELDAEFSTFGEGTIYMGKDQGGLPLHYYTGNVDGVGSTTTEVQTWKHATNKYYWPKNGSLTFTAYAPYNAKNALKANTTDSGVTFSEYEVPTDPTKQEDLLYSERAYNKKAIDADPGKNNTYEGVSLVFKHALSSIHFKVKTADAYSQVEAQGGTTTLIVKSIELLNVASVASFDQNLPDENGGTATVGVWNGFDSKTTYKVDFPSADGITLTKDAVYVRNASDTAPVAADGRQTTDLILIPQVLNDIKLKVTFTLKNDQMAAPIQQVITKDLITDNVTEWKEGCRYLYTISVDLDEIYFEPSVTPWKDVEVTDMGDQKNNNI
ncbi:MAG: fimbrillin family protein [Bacteroidales bacterium]|nr:fimbrillin family protein [Bacteroidales bacterium]